MSFQAAGQFETSRATEALSWVPLWVALGKVPPGAPLRTSPCPGPRQHGWLSDPLRARPEVREQGRVLAVPGQSPEQRAGGAPRPAGPGRAGGGRQAQCGGRGPPGGPHWERALSAQPASWRAGSRSAPRRELPGGGVPAGSPAWPSGVLTLVPCFLAAGDGAEGAAVPGGARRAERPAVQGGGELAQVRPSPRQLLPTVTLQEDAVLDPAPLDPAPCTRRPLRKPVSAGLGPLGPLAQAGADRWALQCPRCSGVAVPSGWLCLLPAEPLGLVRRFRGSGVRA